jgi:heavy metal sensor kinase
MKSYRTRLTVWFGTAFVGLLALVFLCMFAIVYITLYQEERRELSDLATRIEQALDLNFRGEAMQQALPAAVADVNEKISFLFDDEDRNFGYAILAPDGTPLFDFHPPVAVDPFEQMPWINAQPDDFFVRFATYKDCTFYCRQRAEAFTVLVSSTHHLDLVDNLLYALICLPMGIGLAFALARGLSHRIIMPIETISRTAQEIETGDLTARIRDVGSRDEVSDLIEVLNNTFSRLEVSFTAIEHFSADVSHELRTSLTAIHGTLQVCLRRDRSAEEYRATIAQSVTGLDDLIKLTNRLLLLARPHGSDSTVEFSPVDFTRVVVEVCELLSVLAEEKGVTLEVTCPEGMSVSGDAGLLKQAVHNLVHNAIKFSQSGQTVRIRTVPSTNTETLLEVSDSGVGIPADHLSRIFDRLYQVKPSREEGQGLGLAIVKWIAEHHGGRVCVQSEPGHGSMFSLWLPSSQPKA